MRIGWLYGFSPVIRWYMSNRFPYLAEMASRPSRAIAAWKSRNTPFLSGPMPRPSSQTVFAFREATSRGTRFPKAGYLRSR